MKDTLKIAYQGEALQNGTMELRDLAPALLAFSGFVEAVNAIVNGKDTKISLHVKSFERGSFGIELALIDVSVFQEVFNTLSGASATSIANLITYITAAGVSIPWLIRKLRKRRMVQEVSADTVSIELEDGSTIALPRALYKAASDPAVQQYFFDALKPIAKVGIDSMQIFSGEELRAEEATTTVTKESLSEYEPTITDEIISSDVREMWCTIVDLSFEKTEWRISDGSTQFTANISDEAFLEQIRSGEIMISPATQLNIEIKTEQRRIVKNLRTTRTILKVIEIR